MRRPALLCSLGAVLLAYAIHRNSGMYELPALLLATAAAACALIAILVYDSPETLRPAQIVLGVGLAFGLWAAWQDGPTFYADYRQLPAFHRLGLIAALPASAYLCVHLRASLRRVRFVLMLLWFLLMGAVILRASPQPHIDVFAFREMGAASLSLGRDPYAVGYPNLYAGSAGTDQFYAHEVFQPDGRVHAYPYLPESALLDLAGFKVFGDVRWVTLLCMIGAAALIGSLGTLGELAALAMLFQGRAFFVLEQAWTEPLVLLTFSLALFALVRKKGWLAIGLSLGFLCASKQYAPLLALPLLFLIPREVRLKSSALAAMVVTATILPFALWHPREFIRGAVYMQFWQPLRSDALSWLGFAARHGLSLSAAVGFAAALVAFALGLRARTTPGRAAATAAAAWVMFVLFNKQAFCNYDWLGTGLLAAAAACFSGETA